jgi:hypothetical protein
VYPRIGGRRDRASSRRASSVSDSLSTCVREALINPLFAQVSESSSMSVQDAHACLPGILATVRSRMTLLQYLFVRFRLTADASSTLLPNRPFPKRTQSLPCRKPIRACNFYRPIRLARQRDPRGTSDVWTRSIM